MYNVYQHWDPLKVCIVGKSYPPEFYSFITNSRVRNVMERIARETEEDYLKLVALLERFGVEVLRPTISDDRSVYFDKKEGKYNIPPMTPRDYSIMLGNDFYFKSHVPFTEVDRIWPIFKGSDWPDVPPATLEEARALPQFIKDEIYQACDLHIDEVIETVGGTSGFSHTYLSEADSATWKTVIDKISPHANVYNWAPWYLNRFNSAANIRVGKDIYVGTRYKNQDQEEAIANLGRAYPGYRWQTVDTAGHSDSTFCPVVPGLVVSLHDIPTYKDTFPDWEILYLPGESWDKITDFLKLKGKNRGKWWVPGEEYNDDFTDYVESWLNHWVGYVEETVFDVNMLVIDQKNVACTGYNKQVFDTLERYGVTPHIVNFRHRYFWDGGLHCITSDVHREGTMQDYFPYRG